MKKQGTAIAFVGLLGLAAALAPLPACSVLVVNSSDKQCSSDSDCAALGADFANTFCSPQNVCTHMIGYCASNLECIQRTGTEEEICRKDTHTCVGLLSQQCTQVLSQPHDTENDNAVVFGIHSNASWAPQTAAGTNAIEMVREDFFNTEGGLPPTAASGGMPRPVIWVSCDTPIANQGLASTITDFLFNTVGVTASFGPFFDIQATLSGVQEAAQYGTFMGTVAEDESSYNLPGVVGHVYFLGFPLGVETIGQINGVTLIEQLIHARNPAATTLKLAYIYVQGVYEADATSFAENAVFNGKSATANGNNFQEFFYPQPSDPTFTQAQATLVNEVADFKPDIVVFRGADEQDNFAYLIEEQNVKSANGLNPFYLLGVEGRNELSGLYGDILTLYGSAELAEPFRQRVLGLNPGAYDQLPQVRAEDQRYLQDPNINGKDTGVSVLQHAAYDMAYLMYYAAAAVGDSPLTGTAMGAAVTNRITFGKGTAVGMNPSDITVAFGALQNGQNISVTGNMSNQQWDPTTGVMQDWRIQYWCIAPPSLVAASPPDVRIEDATMELGIEYTNAKPMLNGTVAGFPASLVDSTGAAITDVTDYPTGCLSTH